MNREYDLLSLGACEALGAATGPLPLVRPLPVGKMVRLLSARQANAHFFRDLAQLLGGT